PRNARRPCGSRYSVDLDLRPYAARAHEPIRGKTDVPLNPACDEFASGQSVNAFLRLNVLDVVCERELVDRAIVDLHFAPLAAPAFEPGDGVLHPVLVVALGRILLHVRAAAFLAV